MSGLALKPGIIKIGNDLVRHPQEAGLAPGRFSGLTQAGFEDLPW